jgi:hypothetical protein
MTISNQSHYDIEGMSQSNRLFREFIFPLWKQHCPIFQGANELLSIECNRDDTFKTLLDERTGIDFIADTTAGLVSFANRVQYHTNYQTFSLRTHRSSCTSNAVEWRKFQRAVLNGSMHAGYIIQSFLEDRESGKVMSSAMIRLDDLVRFVDDHRDIIKSIDCGDTKSRFYQRFIYVEWASLSDAGVHFHYIRNTGDRPEYFEINGSKN